MPSKFPSYGDFSQTYVMRDYGPWWTECPSGQVSSKGAYRALVSLSDSGALIKTLLLAHIVIGFGLIIFVSSISSATIEYLKLISPETIL